MYNKLFSKDIIIIYHANCSDGTSAAWCFDHYMRTDPNPWIGIKVEYLAADHGRQNMPEYLQGRTVIMLDFTYSKENMIKLIQEAHVTIVLDHHDTSVARLQACEEFHGTKLHYELDMTRSGCQIAWDTFHPNTKRPWFLDYIADRDLWKWELPDSKEVTAALYTLYEHDKIETYAKLWAESMCNPDRKDQIIMKGQVCKQYEQNIVTQLKSTAVLMDFDDHIVLVASCPWMYRSELGNQLAQDERVDFAALYTFVPCKLNEEKEVVPGYFSFSLRGIERKGIALNKIAEMYGGGGHPLACGFRWNGKLEELMVPIPNED